MKSFLAFIFLSSLLFAESLQKGETLLSSTQKQRFLEQLQTDNSPLFEGNRYTFKTGWNRVSTPKEGVDVKKSFQNIAAIQWVVAYDPLSDTWASFSPQGREISKEIALLEYLEPSKSFFVLAQEESEVAIKSHTMNAVCQKYKEDPEYLFVLDSGNDKDVTLSEAGDIALQSRYLTHLERGKFSDTRIALIYPKLKSTQKRNLLYGPAIPRMQIGFSKEYEGKKFYTYDYKTQECYIGVFPSPKIPPLPFLKALK